MTKKRSPFADKQPTKFVCAVCDNPRPLVVDGKPAYAKAGGGNMICFECTNKADQKALDDGQGITLNMEWEDGKWFAVNAGGKLRFALIPRQADMTPAQILGAPMFTHKGRQWSGRFYPGTGTAFFQRVKAAADRTAGGRSNRQPAMAGATVAKTHANATHKPPLSRPARPSPSRTLDARRIKKAAAKGKEAPAAREAAVP